MRPVKVDVEIGGILRGIREMRGISQGALADSLGWKRPRLSVIESGKQSLRAGELGPLAKALGVVPMQLLPERWRR